LTRTAATHAAPKSGIFRKNLRLSIPPTGRHRNYFLCSGGNVEEGQTVAGPRPMWAEDWYTKRKRTPFSCNSSRHWKQKTAQPGFFIVFIIRSEYFAKQFLPLSEHLLFRFVVEQI
jgi:hypothetical protein